MTQSQLFRNGITINIDETDHTEFGRVDLLGHINPSVEFWLKENASSFSKALIVGAGVGVATGILEAESVETINIEPVSERFTILNGNFDTATNIEKACSNESGTGNMYYFADNKSGALLDLIFGDANEEVDIITVDSLGLTDLDLIVINVNGQELDVLKGAETTIANNTGVKVVINWRPDLITSLNTAISYLQSNFSSVNIIHWESDDTISLKEQFTAETEDHLQAVMTADLLLE
tara:strand:- start:422 stop:1129 length:708 start_codon:yes stop_codon:yes gene_type:complete